MRTFICVILLIIAGALPSIIGGWCLDNWQWWAIVIPIDLLALYIYNSEDKTK
jgi:hypothetical protein